MKSAKHQTEEIELAFVERFPYAKVVRVCVLLAERSKHAREGIKMEGGSEKPRTEIHMRD